MKTKTLILALLAGLSLSGAAQATLIDRGGGLIYDDVLNITWLQDANYGAGSIYDNGDGVGDKTDGRMTWANAMDWAANLSYYDSVRNVTYIDWRLPTMAPANATAVFSNNGTTNFGTGATGTGWGLPSDADGIWSELGWMHYHNLGNLGMYIPNGNNSSTTKIIQPGHGLVDGPALNDESLFINLYPETYWFGQQYGPDPAPTAWVFRTSVGDQMIAWKGISYLRAWAVRDGDVAAQVPEPATLLLLGLGLAGLGVMRRRG